MSVFQEQEENKGATSWPEYYIDQLNSMAAVSTSQQNLMLHLLLNEFTELGTFCIFSYILLRF